MGDTPPPRTPRRVPARTRNPTQKRERRALRRTTHRCAGSLTGSGEAQGRRPSRDRRHRIHRALPNARASTPPLNLTPLSFGGSARLPETGALWVRTRSPASPDPVARGMYTVVHGHLGMLRRRRRSPASLSCRRVSLARTRRRQRCWRGSGPSHARIAGSRRVRERGRRGGS